MPERIERELLRNVPIFFGLKVSQMRHFLEACSMKNLPANEVLCNFGEPSKQCWVLLEGRLDILSRDNTPVATLEPVQTVGEMGIIARRPRVATVRSATTSRLLEIGFTRLDSLLESDEKLRSCLYRNFIRVIGERLNDANDMAARYKRLYEEAVGGEPRHTILPPQPADTDDEPEADSQTTDDAPPGEDEPAEGASSAEEHVTHFFELQRRLPAADDMAEGRKVVAELLDEGYSHADIEYAVKWTIRHVPTAKRFGMVRVSMTEALEDRWSI